MSAIATGPAGDLQMIGAIGGSGTQYPEDDLPRHGNYIDARPCGRELKGPEPRLPDLFASFLKQGAARMPHRTKGNQP